MLGMTARNSDKQPELGEGAVTDAEPKRRSNRLKVVPPSPLAGVASQDQRRGVGAWLRVLGVMLDFVIVASVPAVLYFLNFPAGNRLVVRAAVLFAFVTTLLLLPTHRRGRHVIRPSEAMVPTVARVAIAPMITATILAPFTFLDESSALPADVWVLLVGWIVPLILLGRLLMFLLVNKVRTSGYDLEDVIIVGAGPVGADLAKGLQDNPEFGLLPVAFVDSFDERLPLPLVGRPEDLPRVIAETGAHHVILAFGAAPEAELVDYVRQSAHLPVQFYTVPRFFDLGISAERVGLEVDGYAVLPLRTPGHGHSAFKLKRAFDLCVSTFILMVSAPVFAVCAVGVKLSSPGPVFFRQERIGLNGRHFEILKFRSMRQNDDSDVQWTVDDDQRVTKFGAFLRKSHLDELPQLVNVLKGDMSIVGPRPERPFFVDQFSQEIDGYADRHRMQVGITGWAQVNGFWGDSSIESRVRLDNRYIENWSIWRDLVIGIRTIPTFLGKRR